jgi:hypothetical protein
VAANIFWHVYGKTSGRKTPCNYCCGDGDCDCHNRAKRAFVPAARDFEECTEQAQKISLGTERVARIMDCGARFAGRRKVGGGYAYYDLLQNRSFDIAGPNPTANERTRIYSEYIRFLELQRREAALAELEQLATEEPQVETPVDLRGPTTKPSKSKPCMIKGSLSCTWVKLTSAVRNGFASNAKAQALANSR